MSRKPTEDPRLAVDELRLTIIRSARRKSLGLSIERDGSLRIAAPPGIGERELRRFVRSKKDWIYRKLAARSTQSAKPGPKSFISGEGFHYLGRSYRLLVEPEAAAPLALRGGRFVLSRHEKSRARAHFIAWYRSHARTWLAKRIRHWAPILGVEPGEIQVRELGHRWGSCSPTRRLSFHWSLIRLPASAVDYIVVHELAHLREPRHSPNFWALIERVLPDWEKRKVWLAENGAAYADELGR